MTLDLQLPDMDGWRVLDLMKRTADTRHIPVNIISVEERMAMAPQMGAFSVLTKPVDRAALMTSIDEIEHFLDRKVRNLLVVEDDEVQRTHIATLIGNGDVETTGVGTGAAALIELQKRPFDCIILDLGLPDMSGFDVLEEVRKNRMARVPTIVYTARDLTRREQLRLRKLADSIIVKTSDSTVRLFDDAALFLHRSVGDLPEEKQKLLATVRQREPLLADRKALIVDDDVRNIFSLASVLEQHKMSVLHAESGRDAIALLENTPDIDIVFMDIMMPDMDGYETIRTIRARERFQSLPIVAITAKAMKGDREKCLEAGASDYAAKPVDMEQMISIIRVWLRRN